ncbi:MAG: excisionase family DNA-binding protein, partial [Thermomicrobiales bacterium]
PVASEQAALDALRRLLTGEEWCDLKLMGPDGTPLDVPPSVVQALRQVVSALARERVVLVDDLPADLMIQQAADLLDVPASHLARLMEQGEIPFRQTGSHRRVRFADLMAYKERRDAERREGLDEMTRMSQEMGLYDLDRRPSGRPE